MGNEEKDPPKDGAADDSPETDASERSLSKLPHGWVKLGTLSWLKVGFAVPAGGVAFTVFVYGYMALGVVTRNDDQSIVLRIGGALLIVGLVLGIVVLRMNYVAPQIWVNFDSGQLRSGKRVFSIHDLEWAQLSASVKFWRVNGIVLTIGKGKNLRPRFALRKSRTGQLDPETAMLLSEVVRRSSIAMPQSPDDPKGKFAKYNFPGHIDKEEALEMIRNPPEVGAKLPV